LLSFTSGLGRSEADNTAYSDGADARVTRLDVTCITMMGMSETRPGRWIGYSTGPGGKDHLEPDVRAFVEQRERELAERRGRLLCEVQVRVYESDVPHDANMWVSFPPGALLRPDSDPAEIAAAVERARQALAGWR
jgi:hypothetical protein